MPFFKKDIIKSHSPKNTKLDGTYLPQTLRCHRCQPHLKRKLSPQIHQIHRRWSPHHRALQLQRGGLSLSSGKRLFSNLIPTSSTSSTEPKFYRYFLRVILGLRVSCRLFLHVKLFGLFFLEVVQSPPGPETYRPDFKVGGGKHILWSWFLEKGKGFTWRVQHVGRMEPEPDVWVELKKHCIDMYRLYRHSTTNLNSVTHLWYVSDLQPHWSEIPSEWCSSNAVLLFVKK